MIRKFAAEIGTRGSGGASAPPSVSTPSAATQHPGTSSINANPPAPPKLGPAPGPPGSAGLMPAMTRNIAKPPMPHLKAATYQFKDDQANPAQQPHPSLKEKLKEKALPVAGAVSGGLLGAHLSGLPTAIQDRNFYSMHPGGALDTHGAARTRNALLGAAGLTLGSSLVGATLGLGAEKLRKHFAPIAEAHADSRPSPEMPLDRLESNAGR